MVPRKLVLFVVTSWHRELWLIMADLFLGSTKAPRHRGLEPRTTPFHHTAGISLRHHYSAASTVFILLGPLFLQLGTKESCWKCSMTPFLDAFSRNRTHIQNQRSKPHPTSHLKVSWSPSILPLSEWQSREEGLLQSPWMNVVFNKPRSPTR